MSNQTTPIVIGDYPYTLSERGSFRNGPIRDILVGKIFNNWDHYIKIMSLIDKYNEKLTLIPETATNGIEPHWDNGWIPTLDAILLYSILAEINPRYYIEIGSGNSTKFVRRSIDDNNLRTKIVSIDPNPRCNIEALCDHLIRVPLEAYNLDIFRLISPEDIVILDGSHRALPNSDVTVFFCELLPRFPKNLIYAIHDIALPDELYTSRCYNEQYMLAVYLLGGAPDQIYFPTYYLLNHTSIVDRWKHSFKLGARSGKFFWLRKD